MTSLAYLYTVLAQVWAMASLTSCTVGITLACTVGIPNPGNEWASLTLATSGHHSPWQRVGITHPGNEWASLTLATSGHHSPWQRVGSHPGNGGITHPGNEWASLTLATSGHHSP
jgi:hypothetical protein